MDYYLCDGKACENCRSDSSNCMYTTNIEHAVNFVRLGDTNDFVEQPALGELKDSSTELVKELNNLLDKYAQLRFTHIPLTPSLDKVRREVDQLLEALTVAIGLVIKKIKEQYNG